MYKNVEGMENPDHEWKCSVYNSDHTYTNDDLRALYTNAYICIENRLIAEFIRLADEFQCEAGVPAHVLYELDLTSKYLVTAVWCVKADIALYTSSMGVYNTADDRVRDTVLAFGGIDPAHLYDVEFIRELLPDNKGLELTIKLKFNLKPTTAFKYLIKDNDDAA